MTKMSHLKMGALILGSLCLALAGSTTARAQNCLPYDDHTHFTANMIQSTGLPARIHMEGDRAVIANGLEHDDWWGWGGLDLISLADPDNPELLGYWTYSLSVRDAKLAGDLVLFLSIRPDIWDDGLNVMDFSDPANPVLLGPGLPLPGPGARMLTDGGLAYITCGSGHLVAVDISDPLAMTIVGSLDLGVELHDLDLGWDHLICTGEDESVKVIDITDPAAMSLVSSTPLGDLYTEIEVEGDYVHVAGLGMKFLLWLGGGDLEVRGGIHKTEYDWREIEDLLVRGSTAYCVTAEGLYIEDLTVVPDPQRALTLENNDYDGKALTLVDDRLISVRGYMDGYDIPPVEWPVTVFSTLELGDLTWGGLPLTYPLTAIDMAIGATQEILYSVDGERLVRIDISDPSAPVEVAEMPLNSSGGLGLEGNLACMDWNPGTYDWGFQVVDLGTMEILANRNGEGAGRVAGCAVRDSVAYIAAMAGGFWIYGLHSPEYPSKYGGWENLLAYDVKLRGDIAFVLTTGGLYSFDIQDPNNAEMVGFMDLPVGYSFPQISLNGDYGYVGSAGDQLLTLDLQDPTSPSLVDSLNLGCKPTSIDYRNGLMFTTGGYGTPHSLEMAHLLTLDDPEAPVMFANWPDDLDRVLVTDNCLIAAGNGNLYLGPLPCGLTAAPEGAVTAAAATLLAPPFPNPFNPHTTLTLALPVAGEARLDIYDVSGRLVRRLLDGPLAAGTQQMIWDGTGEGGEPQPTGVYFARLVAGEYRESRKLVLLR